MWTSRSCRGCRCHALRCMVVGREEAAAAACAIGCGGQSGYWTEGRGRDLGRNRWRRPWRAAGDGSGHTLNLSSPHRRVQLLIESAYSSKSEAAEGARSFVRSFHFVYRFVNVDFNSMQIARVASLFLLFVVMDMHFRCCL